MSSKFILPEIVKTGIFDSKIIFKDIQKTLPRSISLYEIEFFLNDSGISFVDGKEYKIKSGNILVAKPGQVRNSILPFQCYYLHLAPHESLEKYLDHAPDMMIAGQLQIYNNLFRSLISDCNSPHEGSELLMQSKLFELLYHIHNDAVKHKRNSSFNCQTDNSVILKAMQYIEDNYQIPINLDNIAQEVNLSPIYFHKLFSIATGKTPYNYLLEKRLRTAKDMLLTSELSFTEIAFTCGFSSQSYFNYVFKKETERTPKQFRAQRYEKEYI